MFEEGQRTLGKFTSVINRNWRVSTVPRLRGPSRFYFSSAAKHTRINENILIYLYQL